MATQYAWKLRQLYLNAGGKVVGFEYLAKATRDDGASVDTGGRFDFSVAKNMPTKLQALAWLDVGSFKADLQATLAATLAAATVVPAEIVQTVDWE